MVGVSRGVVGVSRGVVGVSRGVVGVSRGVVERSLVGTGFVALKFKTTLHLHTNTSVM